MSCAHTQMALFFFLLLKMTYVSFKAGLFSYLLGDLKRPKLDIHAVGVG